MANNKKNWFSWENLKTDSKIEEIFWKEVVEDTPISEANRKIFSQTESFTDWQTKEIDTVVPTTEDSNKIDKIYLSDSSVFEPTTRLPKEDTMTETSVIEWPKEDIQEIDSRIDSWLIDDTILEDTWFSLTVWDVKWQRARAKRERARWEALIWQSIEEQRKLAEQQKAAIIKWQEDIIKSIEDSVRTQKEAEQIEYEINRKELERTHLETQAYLQKKYSEQKLINSRQITRARIIWSIVWTFWWWTQTFAALETVYQNSQDALSLVLTQKENATNSYKDSLISLSATFINELQKIDDTKNKQISDLISKTVTDVNAIDIQLWKTTSEAYTALVKLWQDYLNVQQDIDNEYIKNANANIKFLQNKYEEQRSLLVKELQRREKSAIDIAKDKIATQKELWKKEQAKKFAKEWVTRFWYNPQLVWKFKLDDNNKLKYEDMIQTFWSAEEYYKQKKLYDLKRMTSVSTKNAQAIEKLEWVINKTKWEWFLNKIIRDIWRNKWPILSTLLDKEWINADIEFIVKNKAFQDFLNMKKEWAAFWAMSNAEWDMLSNASTTLQSTTNPEVFQSELNTILKWLKKIKQFWDFYNQIAVPWNEANLLKFANDSENLFWSETFKDLNLQEYTPEWVIYVPKEEEERRKNALNLSNKTKEKIKENMSSLINQKEEWLSWLVSKWSSIVEKFWPRALINMITAWTQNFYEDSWVSRRIKNISDSIINRLDIQEENWKVIWVKSKWPWREEYQELMSWLLKETRNIEEAKQAFRKYLFDVAKEEWAKKAWKEQDRNVFVDAAWLLTARSIINKSVKKDIDTALEYLKKWTKIPKKVYNWFSDATVEFIKNSIPMRVLNVILWRK